MLVPDYFDALSFLFNFDGGGVFGAIRNLLWFAIWTASILCILFAVPPQKLPPALQSLDKFAALICAALIAWLPIQVAFMTLGILGLHTPAILMFVHGMIGLLAYFGVLIVTGPAAYERIVALLGGQKSPQA